jgi:hypothetical protein
MAPPRERRPFVPKGSPQSDGQGSSSGRAAPKSGAAKPGNSQPKVAKSGSKVPDRTKGRGASQVIPDAVASRMARRIALATGLPTLLGMGVFIASYLLVSRHILDIPPSATLLASGACFLLGLVGLSYGVLSASWEAEPGSLLGAEQIGVNMARIRSSIRAMRQGAPGSPEG